MTHQPPGPPVTDHPPLAGGTPFGQYRLIELLGRGGMGEVWRAYDTVTDRMVALKLLPAHFAEDSVFKERFRREAHAAAQLNEPHVVPIHTYGEINGRLFVDMRLIRGHDLETVLAAGPLSPARAVLIVEQVAKAVHAAHKAGLVHRDVKPSNILLDDDDFAYLIDFGIARAAGETGLTATGGVVGTLHYMAPERFSTGQADARSDIYALACVLYECLTGSEPFPGDNLEQQLAGHLATPPPRPSHTTPGVPAELDAVIATGMAKDPEERYPTTVELARAARDAITTPIPRPTPPPPAQPPTQPAHIPITAPIVATDKPTPGGVFTSAATQVRPPADLHRPARQPDLTPGVLLSERSFRRPWRRRKPVLIPAALLLAAVAVAAVVIVTTVIPNRGPAGSAPTAQPSTTTTTTTTRGSGYGPQAALPFTGLNDPRGVAVDAAGNVYVSDNDNNRVVRLSAGSNTQSDLPFTGIERPIGVAVSASGDVYVADASRVLKLEAASDAQTTLPFTLDYAVKFPVGVAVSTAGDVFITRGGGAVLKLAVGSDTEIKLPLTGGTAIAVNAAGDVYVTDYYVTDYLEGVMMLAAGSSAEVALPFTGLGLTCEGVAVDARGNVYVADTSNNRVLKLPQGSGSQMVLPFTGLRKPEGVAVNTSGDVFAVDTGNNRVVKLPAS
jgi:serine/threonine-protein kinase